MLYILVGFHKCFIQTLRHQKASLCSNLSVPSLIILSMVVSLAYCSGSLTFLVNAPISAKKPTRCTSLLREILTPARRTYLLQRTLLLIVSTFFRLCLPAVSSSSSQDGGSASVSACRILDDVLRSSTHASHILLTGSVACQAHLHGTRCRPLTQCLRARSCIHRDFRATIDQGSGMPTSITHACHRA